jgi:inorganic pyrophosphatase
LNPDGTVNGYIEIPRGDRTKWEYDMGRNARAIDRVIPRDVGGYPVNYGFVAQTVSYDGDPFDVLVLGPSLEGGRLVRGVIVGLMHMEDEKGLDSKVVLSPVDRNGRATHRLTEKDRRRIGDYFRRYKLHEPGTFSKVPGWGSPAEGLAYVRRTHAFFRECRGMAGSPCQIAESRIQPSGDPRRFASRGLFQLNQYCLRAPTRDPSRGSPGSPTRVLCALGWSPGSPTRVLCALGWSPRVLARCHGAQRVHALRARGRPPRATREPAGSSDSAETVHQ